MTTWTPKSKPNNSWTPVNKATGTSYTKVNKATSSWTNTAKQVSAIISYSNFGFSLVTMASTAFSDLKSGMAFQNSTSGILNSVTFYLSKTGSPTGLITANLYAITGTLGSTAIPTGSALVSSTPIEASTITSTTLNGNNFSDYEAINFVFPSYTMTAGTDYVVDIEYSGGDASNYLQVAGGNSNRPLGNAVNFPYPSGPWATDTHDAFLFNLYIGTKWTDTTKATSSWTKVAKAT